MTKRQKISAIKKLIKFVESDEFGVDKMKGLCGAIFMLRVFVYINDREYRFLDDLIYMEPKSKNYPLYCWKPGSKKPRINWLNKQIKIIEEGKI